MNFIAIIAVMVILIIFIGIAITTLSKQVGKQIDKNVNDVINTYDYLLEEKSRELDEIKAQIVEAKKELESLDRDDDIYDDATNHYEGCVFLESGKYTDQTFFEKYNLIRNEYRDLAKEAAAKTALLLSKKRKNLNVHEYKELLNIFDYELQYQMDTLSSKDQRLVMETIINHSDGKRRIVERYQQEYGDFNFEEFIDYLRSYIFFNDNIVKVYSYNGERIVDEHRPNIEYLVDKTIGEGYGIRYRNEFHDFSLKGGIYE